jgi:hypothetical protein
MQVRFLSVAPQEYVMSFILTTNEHIFRDIETGQTIVCTWLEYEQEWKEQGYEPLTDYLRREAEKVGTKVEA